MDTAAADRAAGDARRRLEPAARGGCVVSGLLHVLIGYLAVRIALGPGGGSADQTGALAQVASTSFGRLALWVAVVALAGLALWQLLDAVTSARSPGGGAGDVVGSAAEGVVHLALAFTATLLRNGAGRVLVAVTGLVVLGIGGYHVVKGVEDRFREDLRGLLPGGAGTAVVWAGRAGHPAKGVALAVLGVLFVVAAVQVQPGRAGGLDAALRTLGGAPFGAVLLVLVGLAAYGVYCFARARYGRL